MSLKLKIHYRNDEVKKLYEAAGVQTTGSAGFDLIACEHFKLSVGEMKLIDLGVVVEIPKGYHALVMPRSSTFKNHGILQANSVGLIDEDYCGPNDFWKFPAIAASKSSTIKKGTRLCQFILAPTIKFDVEEFTPTAASRGGFGSTGV